MDWGTSKDVVLFALAIYGAGLSTANWWQARTRDRRQVLVKMSTAMPTFTNGHVGAPFVRIDATNVGHRDVTVTTISLQLDDKHLVPFNRNAFPGIPDTDLPAALKDGATAHLFFAYSEVGAALIDMGKRSKTKVIPYCEDSTGERHEGEPWEIDPGEFAGMK